jgi:transcriptional regulator with XRE-family HTH domain
MAGDPRILGSSEFVEGLLREAEARQIAALRRGPTPRDTAAVIAKLCKRAGVSVEELQRGGRRGPLSAVRADLARELVVALGLSLAQAARQLGVSTAAISKILSKTDG